MSTKVEKSCETCGKMFAVKPYLASGRRHCSKTCKQSATRIDLTCPGCGKGFWAWRSQLAGRGAKPFCSKDCVDAARRKPVQQKAIREPIFKACHECGESFRIPPSRAQTAMYCSIACKASSSAFRERCSSAQQAEKHWRWAGGKYQTHQGYVRVKRKRGTKETFRWEHTGVMVEWIKSEAPSHPFLVVIEGELRLHPDIEVHHIDRDRSNNARGNLLAVTKDAHARIHHNGTKPEPWECWPPNVTRW